MRELLFFSFMLLIVFAFTAQNNRAQQNTEGRLIMLTSRFAPLPHEKRAEGHTYQDSLYDFVTHYNDSSVAVFIPAGFKGSDSIDLVFYFHGWGNHIQKSIDKFDLTGQFTRSRRNALFIFPEGPVDAPDSFGGKMENKNVFRKLIVDILMQLKTRNLISNTNPGRIVLSGHSGAYRAIAYILNRGGLTDHIKEVWRLMHSMHSRKIFCTGWIILTAG